MSMRISSAAVTLLLLAGCGGEQKADTGTLAQTEADSRVKAADDGRLDCAPAGENAFQRSCLLDQTRDADGNLVLTVSHPDGSFRRLLVTTDGRGVVAADGAEKAVVTTINPREIEVSLAGNRYRLPATVKQ
jgi:hypothetical protein